MIKLETHHKTEKIFLNIGGKWMKDEMGDYIKRNYENKYRFYLPTKTYTILRIDGKAFHTVTKGLDKPFDMGLIEDMDNAACKTIAQIQNAQFGYIQSDEFSILLFDGGERTESWFDNNLNKLISVSASLYTAEFNYLRMQRWLKEGKSIDDYKPSAFDSRAFIIPSKRDVVKYFVWRNLDCTRNAVSMIAQSLFSHKQLQGKSSKEMQEMMFSEHGINFNDYNLSLKSGRLIVTEQKEKEVTWTHKKTQEVHTQTVMRNEWVNISCPILSRDPNFLYSNIPDLV